MLYSKVNFGLRQGMDVEKGYEPGAWEALKLGFREGWETGPFRQTERLFRDAAADDALDMTSEEQIEYAREWRENPGLDLKTQGEMIAAAGLTGKLKPVESWSRETLETMIDARRESEERRYLLGKASGLATAAAFTGEIAGGAIDPLELAGMFVPVVGEERKLALLARAGGIWGRSAARAGIGAAEGLAGAAMLEPASMASASLGQADYGMLQSLMNVAGGAAFGAMLHPMAGLVNEWRVKDRWIKPWEMAERNQDSQEMISRHARAIAEARMKQDATLDAEAARREGLAHALAYDTFSRNRAWREKQELADIYREWEIDYQSGQFIRRGVGEGEAHAPQAGRKLPTGVTPGQKAAQQVYDRGELKLEESRVTDASGKMETASSVEFVERQRAVINFFQAADKKSAGHELIHIMRRQLEEASLAADASPRARALWADVEKACGVEPGERWSVEAEEKFARQAMDYFWTGHIRDANLAPAVRQIRSMLLTVQEEAERDGITTSPKVDRAIKKIWQASHEDYRACFNRALLSQLLWEPEPQAHPLGSVTGASPEQAAAGRQTAAQPSPAAEQAPSQASPETPAKTEAAAGTKPGETPAQTPGGNASQPETLSLPGDTAFNPDLHNPDIAPEQVADIQKELHAASQAHAHEIDSLENRLDEKTISELKAENAQAQAEYEQQMLDADMLALYAACVLEA